MRTVLAGVALLLAAPLAQADCPPMSVYTVAGMTADSVPMPDAMRLLFEGTAWTADVRGDAASLRLSYRNVAGPLDQVLSRAISQAGQAAGTPLSAVTDPQRCIVTVTMPPRPQPPAAPTPAPAPRDMLPSVEREIASGPSARAVDAAPAVATPLPAAPVSRVLHAGENLSAAVSRFVAQRGWQIRWLIQDDYVLDADITLPTSDVIEGVTWIVRVYQAQGALEGVVPRFARGNNVVVIESMDVRED